MRMKHVVARLLGKTRGLPTDLPINDIISPVKEYIGTSGVYWKIYRATLLLTDAEVSVFVFDKNVICKHRSRKRILELVRHHIEVLKSMQKYSHVCLKLVFLPRESRRYIAFATEPVLGSLANVLGDVPSDISANRSTVFNKVSMSELEVKYGISIVTETLSYLHLSERLTHCDISPRNIIVCVDRSWKLFGFYFCVPPNTRLEATIETAPTRDTHDWLQPDVNFAAPNLYLSCASSEGDIFSLGMVISALYNNGISLLEGTAVISQIYDAACTSKKASLEADYDERISCAYNAIKCRIPEALRYGLTRLISFNTEKRPTAQQFLMLAFFQDPAVRCLKQLAAVETLTEKQKEELFTVTLPACAPRFPQTLLLVHVYPILFDRLAGLCWSPGIMSMMVCFLERCQSISVLEKICPEVNRVLTHGHWLSDESFQVLMDRLPKLIDKCYRIPSLADPFKLITQGLLDNSRLLLTLNSMKSLVVNCLTSQLSLTDRLCEELRNCMDRLVTEGTPELSHPIFTMVSHWLSLATDERFTEQICHWLLQLFNDHHDVLGNQLIDMYYTLLSNAGVVKLKRSFLESSVIPAMEGLFLLPNISVPQRQKLMQLVCKIENHCRDPKQTTSGRPSSLELCAPDSTTLKSELTSNRTPTATPISPTAKCSSVPQQRLPVVPVIIECADDSSVSQLSGCCTSSPPLLSAQTSQTSTPDSVTLMHLDVSDMKDRRKSFGELMADIEERNDRQWRQSSPLLNGGRSSTALSVAGSSQSEEAPPELSIRPPETPRQPMPRRNKADDDKVDRAMQSLLMQLDSLTDHFLPVTRKL